MERFSFVLQIDPANLETYLERHRNVDQDLLQAFRETGVRTYSIYYDNGRLYAYMEALNIKETLAMLEHHPANVKWQQFMSDLLLRQNGEVLRPINEVFHFESS
ncbi:L-rhamnose mutarotase [Paenibacillus sp. J5C_2022]|uniref:L-rhamnose mutarotase n=1 Tax=Paenibacillus sp. J5C2022 TaxID=2977129 RepID=UPI0021D1844A|nr:L-rhamnose mutarotase [Paenibacillus sp. J5C2022]MCU6709121.1 L-rhamnose mutarotase [Paenibacillus sp. J5C2022]